MGMYDSVYFKCPSCGGLVEAQSKAGECELDVFDPDAVPFAVAQDMRGDTVECSRCHEPFTVHADAVPATLKTWIK